MTDHDYMARALVLAERGRGYVEPNPLVGAVVVRDGQIVGEGWHERYGQAHAEINALNRAGELARGSTLYVTLEPCCHFGKTPPCTDAVIRTGVQRVVAAMPDPFPLVSGQGNDRLRAAGIEVEVGIGESAARTLNAPYLKLLRAGKPWIHAKWAMSLDGRIATRTHHSKWITGEAARKHVHELRGRMDGIIIGRGTLVADDPLLTARPPGPRVATRIVLTASGDIPDGLRLFTTSGDAPVLIFSTPAGCERLARLQSQGCELFAVEGSTEAGLSIDSILLELGRRRVTNVMIEGGAGVLGAFRDAGAIDEVHAFIAPLIIGGENALPAFGGTGAGQLTDAMRMSNCEMKKLDDDYLLHGFMQ